MLAKLTVCVYVAMLGLGCCGLVGAYSPIKCDVRGISRKASIPTSCSEGVITFDYPWLRNKKRTLVIKHKKKDFVLCIYSCTEDVNVVDSSRKEKSLKTGETWCLEKGQKAIKIKNNANKQSYAVLFRYLDKADLQTFKKQRNKTCLTSA